MMFKLSTLLLGLASSAFAVPLESRQSSLVAVTDNYLYSLTLPQFTAKRNARDPATLDWTTDGCTMSPDNPLGFPFTPACHRHDFGYHNYRIQNRFTTSGKQRIDDQFKKDLYYQCSSVTLSGLCRGLADVYYAAVRAFGGSDANSKRAEDALVAEYEEKLAIYNQMLDEAREQGLLPEGV
ncbi:phospholipase A2 [Podospora aff. communis PSN243]|uniref:Phospholipase A2 n=1 Tax=Podospora aff. communis PSN243 TaxID=3040156 RepID=A0AAV9G4D1_9PEZI|nr:phospholipase A2 [Podospora aff. communis PSN243]